MFLISPYILCDCEYFRLAISIGVKSPAEAIGYFDELILANEELAPVLCDVSTASSNDIVDICNRLRELTYWRLSIEIGHAAVRRLLILIYERFERGELSDGDAVKKISAIRPLAQYVPDEWDNTMCIIEDIFECHRKTEALAFLRSFLNKVLNTTISI